MEKQENWLNELHEISNEVINAFSKLPQETLYLKPSPQEWSISENLNHLIIVNSSYFPIFQKLKAGTFQGPFLSKIGIFPKMLGNLIYKSVSDGGKRKVKTFPLWEPSKAEISGDILEEFQQHQKKLMDWVIQMKPYVEKKVIIYSPINKMIVYSLEKAFDIIVAHEQRHLDQAKRVIQKIMLQA